jgi:hypothetical protein
MSKPDKKKAKLQSAITALEAKLQQSLGKKDSRTVEIDVPGTLRQIAVLKKQLEAV